MTKAQLKSKLHSSVHLMNRRPFRLQTSLSTSNKFSNEKSPIRDILRSPIQAKVVIGQVGDQYEREADAVADRVVAGQAIPKISSITSLSNANHDAQRQTTDSDDKEQAEEESVQTKNIQREVNEEQNTDEDKEEEIQLVQRESILQDEEPEQDGQAALIQREASTEQEEEAESVQMNALQREALIPDEKEEDQPVQAKASGGGISVIDVAAKAISSKGSGTPMQVNTRQRLESGLQQDLSGVRIHETPHDRLQTRRIGARAFTHKNHIWLGEGESQNDLHLMAHETTHVLQQGGVGQQKYPGMSQPTGLIQKKESESANNKEDADEKEPGWIIRQIVPYARNIPGYHLLSVILGRDPLSREKVARNASSLIRGILGLVPGGNALFENLQKAGVIERAYQWFSRNLEKYNLTWTAIKALFKQAWDSLSEFALLNPSKAFQRIKSVFTDAITRISHFASAAVKKVLKLTFEGALSLAGGAGKQVMKVINKGKQTFGMILNDPVGFLSNLLNAVGQGFRQFSSNIGKHLRRGFLGWMFGTFSKAGLEMPEKFDLKGIVSIMMQVLGITYDRLRTRLVKLLGERAVSALEKGIDFLKLLVTEGIAGAWQKINEYMGSVRSMIVGGIRRWVVTNIVTTGITKLVSMFNPVGAIIQAIQTIYKTVMFFIERSKQIMALANSVFDSVSNIAMGKIKIAADFVEQSMGRSIPVIISFLARQLGLRGVADKVKSVIEKIQSKVDTALDKLIGFIVSKSRKLTGSDNTSAQSARSPQNELNETPLDEPKTDEEKQLRLDQAVQAVSRISEKADVKSNKDMEAYFPQIKQHYKLKYIGFRSAPGGIQELHLEINPKRKFIVHEYMEGTGIGRVKTDVKWETGSLGGVKVGKRMRADFLGPDHPQGTQPESGAHKSLMNKLVTDKNQSTPNKYIKGHLLNDNLGGEGKEYNLYPITAEANQKHHDSIEERVKMWVNTERYWVSYSVDVEEKGHNLKSRGKSAKNYVNCVLKCRAAIKGVDGKEYDKVTSSITSTFKASNDPVVRNTLSNSKPRRSKAAKEMEVKLSRSKGDQVYIVNTELYKAMTKNKSQVHDALVNVVGLGEASWVRLNSYYETAKKRNNKDITSYLKSKKDRENFSKIMGNADVILSNL